MPTPVECILLDNRDAIIDNHVGSIVLELSRSQYLYRSKASLHFVHSILVGLIDAGRLEVLCGYCLREIIDLR